MSYSSEVLADSPAVYLKLDEASGTVAADASGNGRDFTNNGATVNQPTVMPSGTASYDFTTVAHRLSRADAAWMQTSTFTMEAWVRADVVSSRHCIASRDNDDSFYSGMPRGPAFYIYQGKLNVGGVTAGTALSVGVAYHVVLTYDGTTARLYLNGALDGSGAATFAPASFSAPMYVGAAHPADPSILFPFDGRIDEYAYYGSTLSAARIAAHYAAGTAPPATTGALAASMPALSSSLSGTSTPPEVTGSVTASLPALTGSLTGSFTPPPVTGSLSATLPALSADLTGGSSAAVVTGSLAATISAPFGELAGSVHPVGSFAATLPSLTGDLSGIVAAPGVIAGVLSATIPALTGALVGTPAIASAATDTFNRANGRSRSGKGWANLSEPVAPTPPGIDVEPVRVMAQTLPVPVLSQGRPT